jgi:uncharacterized protein
MYTIPHGAPWYKYGHVWLVIAGPAAVVVAALATAWIAVRSPDPVLEEDYYRRGIQINKQLAAEKSSMPALQGRNHAATPPPAQLK